MALPLNAGSDEALRRLTLLNDIISKTTKDFETTFEQLTLELMKLFPRSYHLVSGISARLANREIDMVSLRDWYVTNVVPHSGYILGLSTDSIIDMDTSATISVLPGVTCKRLLYDREYTAAIGAIAQHAAIADRNTAAMRVIVSHLPKICIWAEMLHELNTSPSEITVIDRIVSRFLAMMKGWRERTIATDTVITLDNMSTNYKHVAAGKQQHTLFKQTSAGISPMLVTLVKIVVMQTNATFFNITQFNKMLDDATEENIAERGARLRNFVIETSMKRHSVDLKCDIMSLVSYNNFSVQFVPNDAAEFEEEHRLPGRTVSKTTRTIPIVYFTIAKADIDTYKGAPRTKLQMNPETGEIIVIVNISSNDELEAMMKLPGRKFGYRNLPVPLIEYTISEPSELTSDTITALVAKGRRVAVNYSIIDEVRFAKDKTDSDITVEIFTIVIRYICSLPKDIDPIDRMVNTYNTLNARFAKDLRYKNFSFKDVFTAILVYVQDHPFVEGKPKLKEAVLRTQAMAARPSPEPTADDLRALAADPTYKKPVSAEDLAEIKSIAKLTFAATDNSSDEHMDLINKCFKCYNDYNTNTLDPDEVSSIVKLAMTDGFIKTDVIDDIDFK